VKDGREWSFVIISGVGVVESVTFPCKQVHLQIVSPCLLSWSSSKQSNGQHREVMSAHTLIGLIYGFHVKHVDYGWMQIPGEDDNALLLSKNLKL
jgi:hypothetical protein